MRQSAFGAFQPIRRPDRSDASVQVEVERYRTALEAAMAGRMLLGGSFALATAQEEWLARALRPLPTFELAGAMWPARLAASSDETSERPA